MKGIPNFVWLERQGRNSEDEKFHFSVLVSSTGEILAEVCHPLRDGYDFNCSAKPNLDGESNRFIDLKAAMRFCEKRITRFLPKKARRRSPIRTEILKKKLAEPAPKRRR